jgi:RND family efflux transporter MFP subunit
MKFALILLGLLVGAAHGAEYPAVLDWSQRVDLGTPVSGVVDQVLAHPGQIVKHRTTLVSLDKSLFEANVMEARADLNRLDQEHTDALRELERAKELYARTVTSTTELDLAKLREARVSAQRAAAQARLDKAQRQLEETSVRAPFDAIILARLAEPGLVTSQCQPTPLIGIARADEILARAEVGATQAAGVSVGATAEVNLSGRRHAGQVRALRPLANGRYSIEAVIARGPELLAGMTATLRLP